MKRFVAALLGIASVIAQAADDPLHAERWKTRPLIVVVPRADDPQLAKLRGELAQPASREAFVEREMVLYTVISGVGSRNEQPLPAEQTQALLNALDAHAGQPAMLYLVGKDGGVKVRERQGWSARELFITIDRMPMRRQAR